MGYKSLTLTDCYLKTPQGGYYDTSKKQLVDANGDGVSSVEIVATGKTKTYTVTYLNWDGTELGTEQVAEGEAAQGVTATRDGYTFVKWRDYISGDDVDLMHVTADMTVEAVFTEAVYTVIYRVEGVVTYTIQVVHGFNASSIYYPHGTPVKEPTNAVVYTFDHWTPEVETITGDVTFDAVFAESPRTYTVRFLNWDGTVLQSSEWEYNSTPVYSGETPLRAEDEENTYAFAGWDKEIAAVTATADYTAVFTATAKAVYFTVTYYDWDLTILGTEKVEEGHDAQGFDPEPTRDGYIFTGWSKPLTNITSDLSVQATYKENPGTGIDEVESQKSKVESTKFLRDGVLYIMHNGTLYDVQGQRVK